MLKEAFLRVTQAGQTERGKELKETVSPTLIPPWSFLYFFSFLSFLNFGHVAQFAGYFSSLTRD